MSQTQNLHSLVNILFCFEIVTCQGHCLWTSPVTKYDDEDDGNMMYKCPIVIDNQECSAAFNSHMKLMAHIRMAHNGRNLIDMLSIPQHVYLAEAFVHLDKAPGIAAKDHCVTAAVSYSAPPLQTCRCRSKETGTAQSAVWTLGTLLTRLSGLTYSLTGLDQCL